MPQSDKPHRPTTREVELAKIAASEKKWVEGFKFGASLAKYLTIGFSVYFVFEGLQEIVLSKPENIDALSNFVKAIRLGEGLGYVLAGVGGVGWYRERKGKKRAIALKGKYQKQLEENDPGRTTSGLTVNGDCPEEEK